MRLAVASIRSSLKAHDRLSRRKDAQLVHVNPRPTIAVFYNAVWSRLSILAGTGDDMPSGESAGILRMIELGCGIRFQ